MTTPKTRHNNTPAVEEKDTTLAQTFDQLFLTPDHAYPPVVDLQQALKAYSDTVTQIRQSKDVHTLTLHGQRYVMKFHRPGGRTRIRAWASSALYGALFKKFPAPKHLLPGGIQYEARRLRALRKKGARVPRVHRVTDDHILIDHCGETVESLLKSACNVQRSDLLWAAVEDLIEFHQAGHWHGGAQVRNLTLKDGRIYRIDFEEPLGEALPLEHSQAFDVLLAFNSLVDYLASDRKQQGVALLSHYLKHTPSGDVITTLANLNKWFKHFHRLEARLPKKLRQKRDVQRTRLLAKIVSGALDSSTARLSRF